MIVAEPVDVLQSVCEARRPKVARALRAILAFEAIRTVDAERLQVAR